MILRVVERVVDLGRTVWVVQVVARSGRAEDVTAYDTKQDAVDMVDAFAAEERRARAPRPDDRVVHQVDTSTA